MNKNTLSKDLEKLMKQLKELEKKHNVKLAKGYKALNEERIESIIEEAFIEQRKGEKK